MARLIIDTPHSIRSRANALASQGVRCVIRYYNRQNSQTFPDKRLTRQEAVAITDAGMRLAVVFQQNHRLLSDFSAPLARSDAKAAANCAGEVGQPTGSAIYVAVDHDFFRTAELDVIQRYFERFRTGLAENKADYRLGVYGSGAVATRLQSAGLVDYVWLARPLGWSGSRDYLKSAEWDLYQDAIDLKLDGLDCDSNITRAGNPDFGQFDLGDAMPLRTLRKSGSAGDRTLFEVTARSSVNMRGGPSLDFNIIRSLSCGVQLYGLQRIGDWLQVDLEGDGLPDGFVSSHYLAPLAGLADDLPSSGQQPIDIAYREYELLVTESAGPDTHPRIALYYKAMDVLHADHDDDEVPWCSYFANFCFSEVGRRGSGRSNARSWAIWGKERAGPPQRGDIVVLWRDRPDSRKGHVGFIIGHDRDDWLLLGGNQGDAVSIRPFDPSRVIAVRHQ